MHRPLVLALVLAASGCAAVDVPPTRRVVSLSRPGPEVAAGTELALAGTQAEHGTHRSQRFEIASTALTRAFGRSRTVGAEVVVPEGFRPDEELAVAYHVPDLGQDPERVAEHFAGLPGLPRLVLVVLDPRGIHGHHAFADSVNEGPHGEALVTDLIPLLEQHLFAGGSARRRFVTGRGLGGWSAMHLQLEYCHAFDAAYAFDPDPLDLGSFYGTDLVRAALEDEDGAVQARRLRNLRDGDLGGRLASLEAAIGARGDDGRPLPLFSGGGAHVDPEVVAAFARKDPATHVRARGPALAPRLEGKIHAIARDGDPLGRDLSLRSFEAALKEARVESVIRTPRSYDLDRAIAAAWTAMVAPAQP